MLPDYHGCRVRLGVPTAYGRTDEIVQYLRNKMPGVTVEVVTTDKVGPEISGVDVPPTQGSAANPAETHMLLAKGWLDEFLLPNPLQ